MKTCWCGAEAKAARGLCWKHYQRERRTGFSDEARALHPMTDEFLNLVAAIYGDNFHSYPTKAVGQAFGVAPRTASQWVQIASDRGLIGERARGGSRRVNA